MEEREAKNKYNITVFLLSFRGSYLLNKCINSIFITYIFRTLGNFPFTGSITQRSSTSLSITANNSLKLPD